MLFNFQFPFMDLRGYLQEETHRIPAPTWPIPDEGEFIRSCGSVGERKKNRYISSGHQNPRHSVQINDNLNTKIFSEENKYCFAINFIKFPTLSDQGLIQCAFRRMFVDPSGVCRLDIGFKTDIYSQEDFESIQKLLFQLPICMKRSCGYHKSPECGCKLTPMYMLSNRVAQKYLESTSYRKNYRSNHISEWWVQPGRPILVAIFSKKEQELAFDITSGYTFMGKEEMKETQTAYDLFHQRHFLGRKKNRKLESWYIICKDTIEGSDNVVRNFRINLLRLHAEKTSLMEIARSIKKKQLTLDESLNTSADIALLKKHLKGKTQTLLTAGETPASADILQHILIKVFQYDLWANREDYDHLQYILGLVNPDLFNKVRQVLDHENTSDAKTRIKNYIKDLKIEDALELLKEVASQSADISFTVNEVVLLQFQWNDLASSVRTQTISFENANVQKSRMIKTLLEFSEMVKSVETQHDL